MATNKAPRYLWYISQETTPKSVRYFINIDESIRGITQNANTNHKKVQPSIDMSSTLCSTRPS